MYKIQISLAKISVVLFLLRIFQTPVFRYIAYGLIGINSAIGFTWALVDSFRCLPVHLAWDGWTNEESGQCINFIDSILVNCLVNIFVDAVTIALPIWEVSKLQMPMRQKITVALMFVVGSLYVLPNFICWAEEILIRTIASPSSPLSESLSSGTTVGASTRPSAFTHSSTGPSSNARFLYCAPVCLHLEPLLLVGFLHCWVVLLDRHTAEHMGLLRQEVEATERITAKTARLINPLPILSSMRHGLRMMIPTATWS